MDRMELFLALLVYLLAALVYETSDGNTPEFILIPVLMVPFAFPLYVGGALFIEVYLPPDVSLWATPTPDVGSPL